MYTITGVGGYVAAVTAERMLEEIDPSQLRVTSRNEDNLAACRARGVDARKADYEDVASLQDAFEGTERLFMVSAMEAGPHRQRQHRNAVSAAISAGVAHVVYTSFIGVEKSEVNSVEVADHKLTESLIMGSGMTWNFLRNNQYADAMAENQAVIAITSGKSIGNTGDAKVGFVARDDVAAVAAKVMLGAGEPDTAYEVTGPDLLSYREVGEMIAELSGASIEIVDLTDEQMYAMWDALGVPREATGDFSQSPVPWCSDGMVTFGQLVRSGNMAKVTDVVEQFTGRKPRSLLELMHERRHTWPTAAVDA